MLRSNRFIFLRGAGLQKRELYSKGTAYMQLALDIDDPAKFFHKPFCNGKPKPRASAFFVSRFFDTVKTLKNMWNFRFRNTNAVILNLNNKIAFGYLSKKLDHPASGGIFYSIFREVCDNLDYGVLVSHNPDFFICKIHTKRDVMLFGKCLQ